MSQYKAAAADGVKPEVVNFFESFYHISDTADAHEKYADQFTKDAKLVMASNETSGRDGIIKMRQGMWEKVASRSHKPTKIFAGSDSHEVMLFGTVDYELKDGKKATDIEWAARAHFSPLGGAPKMDEYQVYLDTAAMAAKAK